MRTKNILLLLFVLLLAGCGSQPAAAPTEAPLPAAEEAVIIPTERPTDAPLQTATTAPTETALPEPTATLVPSETALPEPTDDPMTFGFVSSADAPVGFMLEPVAQVIFEDELQKRLDAGEFSGFQVEGLSIVPRGDGTFFAEIFYALQADAAFWPEDFGSPAEDGWVRGKCTRFDFEITADAYFLKNKAICN